MDLSFNAEERAFQDEVRGFIAKNLTEEMKRATALTPSVFSDPDIGMAWQRALNRRGWGAPGWPVDHGGPAWTAAQRWIFETESARAGVPNVNVMGVKMVGPVIIGHQRCAQRHRTGFVDLHRHVGEAVADHLVGGQRPAELLSYFCVFERLVEQGLHDADGLGTKRCHRAVDDAFDRG